jgi:hypothetical protein
VNPRRKVLGPLVALALAATVVRPAAAPAVPPPEVFVSRTVHAQADTYVSEAAPAQTAGVAPRLVVDGAPRRIAFLRFAVPDFDGRVRSATLRLHVADVPGAGSRTGGTVLASSDTSWDASLVDWTTRPALDGALAGSLGAVRRNQWVERDVTALVRAGRPLTLGVRSAGADDVAYDAGGSGRGPRLVLDLDAPPNGVIVDAVGDLVCGAAQVVTPQTCHEMAVSDLIVDDPDVEAFFALGDLQYNAGSLADFQTYYEPTYGRVKPITRPVIGNHKYQTPNGDGYWDYFGAQAGTRYQGWYSFDLGNRWHVVALNSNCGQVSCANGSPQLQWLRGDLQANNRPCVAAVFHHPRWSSGKAPGDNPSVDPFVRVLQRHRAELILSGHSHNYERFARQRPDGRPAHDGIRQFVVGTGGRSVDQDNGFARPYSRNSQFRLAHVFGLLRLSLTDNAFWWSFVDENGRVRDSGTDRCH